MGHGRYLRKLYLTFFAIAGFFTLLFGGSTFGLMLSSQRSDYRQMLSHTIAIKSDSTQVTLNTISSAIDALISSDSFQNWADSPVESPSYYYHSIFLRQKLSHVLANVSRINYNIFATRSDENSFVITNTGTVEKEDFFASSDCGISHSEWSELVSSLSADSPSCFFPLYKDGSLHTLYYLQAVFEPSGSELLLLTAIPASTLFGSEASQEYVAYQDGCIIAYSSLNDQVRKSLENSVRFLEQQPPSPTLAPYSEFSYGGNELFLLYPQEFPLTIAYQYDYASLWSQMLWPALVIFFLYAFLTFGAAIFFTKKLYYPIHEVLETVPVLPSDGKPIDEFQIIRQNTSTLSLLNEQLEVAIREKQQLAKRRYYRELLFGVPDLNCPLSADQMSAGYCVAIVEFLPDEQMKNDDWYLQLQKNYLYVDIQTLQPEHNIYCVSTDWDRCAIILQSPSRADAEPLIEKLFSIPSVTCNLRIALSDVHEHVIHIQDCYQQALHLMEYRYVFPSMVLITSDKLQTSTTDNYYYPMSVEASLIQAIASGRPDAVESFDSIIEENFHKRSLGVNPTKNLIFVLIGTLMRSFEELKTSPEEILGYSIDFSRLYASDDHSHILSLLRETIQQFVLAVQQRHQNSDDELLTKMLKYIYQNYADDIMLNDIADYCGISPSYCSTLFKRLSRDNFKTFLNRYRIQQACEFLQKDPNIKIAALSQMVGFNSSGSFIRVFSRFIGTSPKAYAEQFHNTK